MGFLSDLAQLLQARFSLLYVESSEEPRVRAEIAAVAGDATLVRTPREVVVWTPTRGLGALDTLPDKVTLAPAVALDRALGTDRPTVFVFCDLHTSLGVGNRLPDPHVVRRLREIAVAFRTGSVPRSLILLSPLLRIPPELERDITLVDFPLPDEDEIRDLLDDMITTNAQTGRVPVELTEDDRERFAHAAIGLTLHEAENAFARAMVTDRRLTASDIDVVLDEKRQTVRKSGLLEFVPTTETLDDVGGLDNLTTWLLKRSGSWLAEAAPYGLPAPKGVLITGVPGCGKSLTARATSTAWSVPLLRLDLGRVFAGPVGAGELNMRKALRAAEAVAPCVLWIDEIEKGLAATGAFLTWMQEKSQPVFVVATANNATKVPPELLRKGRFDEVFFVDLPSHEERQAIWQLHLTRRLKGREIAADVTIDDVLIKDLAKRSQGFSGAEIEQAIIAALFDAFGDLRDLSTTDLVHAVEATMPLAVIQQETVTAMRHWAATRAMPASPTDSDAAEVSGGGGRHLRRIQDESSTTNAAWSDRREDATHSTPTHPTPSEGSKKA